MNNNKKMAKNLQVALVILSIPLLGGWGLLGDAKIKTTCSIKGSGSGKCTFTNTGNASGKVCGKVSMNIIDSRFKRKESDPDKIYSTEYCSGKVEPSSSVQIDVDIPGISDFCYYSPSSTDSNCAYSWEE